MPHVSICFQAPLLSRFYGFPRPYVPMFSSSPVPRSYRFPRPHFLLSPSSYRFPRPYVSMFTSSSLAQVLQVSLAICFHVFKLPCRPVPIGFLGPMFRCFQAPLLSRSCRFPRPYAPICFQARLLSKFYRFPKSCFQTPLLSRSYRFPRPYVPMRFQARLLSEFYRCPKSCFQVPLLFRSYRFPRPYVPMFSSSPVCFLGPMFPCFQGPVTQVL